MKKVALVVAFASLSACGNPSSRSLDDQSPIKTAAAEPTSTPSHAEERQQPDLKGPASTSITKPVALLKPEELKAVEELSNEILRTYFFGTRRNGNIDIWSSPQRHEVIREGAQYALSTETIYMYNSPDSILRVEDNRIIWKDPSNIKRIKLSTPITLDVYSFALKEPSSQSQASVVAGIKREIALHSRDIAQRGMHCRLGETIVSIMEGTTAPDGSKLQEISLFPLTVSID